MCTDHPVPWLSRSSTSTVTSSSSSRRPPPSLTTDTECTVTLPALLTIRVCQSSQPDSRTVERTLPVKVSDSRLLGGSKVVVVVAVGTYWPADDGNHRCHCHYCSYCCALISNAQPPLLMLVMMLQLMRTKMRKRRGIILVSEKSRGSSAALKMLMKLKLKLRRSCWLGKVAKYIIFFQSYFTISVSGVPLLLLLLLLLLWQRESLKFD